MGTGPSASSTCPPCQHADACTLLMYPSRCIESLIELLRVQPRCPRRLVEALSWCPLPVRHLSRCVHQQESRLAPEGYTEHHRPVNFSCISLPKLSSLPHSYSKGPDGSEGSWEEGAALISSSACVLSLMYSPLVASALESEELGLLGESPRLLIGTTRALAVMDSHTFEVVESHFFRGGAPGLAEIAAAARY